jgi:hypothetical protein
LTFGRSKKLSATDKTARPRTTQKAMRSIYQSARLMHRAQMVDFMRFAQAAARGEKIFVVAHGQTPTPYASTADCAEGADSWTYSRSYPRNRRNPRLKNLRFGTFRPSEGKR